MRDVCGPGGTGRRGRASKMVWMMKKPKPYGPRDSTPMTPNVRAAIDLVRWALDGSGVNTNFITGAGIPDGVAIYGEHIYWAGAGSLVARANLEGSGVNLNFITGANFSSGMAVDGSRGQDGL
jgi:hypothetical protein